MPMTFFVAPTGTSFLPWNCKLLVYFVDNLFTSLLPPFFFWRVSLLIECADNTCIRVNCCVKSGRSMQSLGEWMDCALTGRFLDQTHDTSLLTSAILTYRLEYQQFSLLAGCKLGCLAWCIIMNLLFILFFIYFVYKWWRLKHSQNVCEKLAKL